MAKYWRILVKKIHNFSWTPCICRCKPYTNELPTHILSPLLLWLLIWAKIWLTSRLRDQSLCEGLLARKATIMCMSTIKKMTMQYFHTQLILKTIPFQVNLSYKLPIQLSLSLSLLYYDELYWLYYSNIIIRVIVWSFLNKLLRSYIR